MRRATKPTITKETLLHRILARRGISTAQIAAATGVKLATLHNLASGNSRSRRLREKITYILQETIWPEIRVRKFTIPAGTELLYTRPEETLGCLEEFGDSVTVSGAVVRFQKPTVVVWLSPQASSPRRKAVPSSLQAHMP